MSVSEGLQLLNLLVLPGVYYIIRLERRILELELRLKLYFEVHSSRGGHGNEKT